jgi:hypothetical protein
MNRRSLLVEPLIPIDIELGEKLLWDPKARVAAEGRGVA